MIMTHKKKKLVSFHMCIIPLLMPLLEKKKQNTIIKNNTHYQPDLGGYPGVKHAGFTDGLRSEIHSSEGK